jgi:hypothetical protein
MTVTLAGGLAASFPNLTYGNFALAFFLHVGVYLRQVRLLLRDPLLVVRGTGRQLYKQFPVPYDWSCRIIERE